jgi:hypothetical protein
VYEPLVGCKTVKLVIGFGNVRLGGTLGDHCGKQVTIEDEALKRMPFGPQLHAEQFRMGVRDKYSFKKLRKIFLISKEIRKRADAKSYMRKSFPSTVYEEMREYLVVYEEAFSHI